MASSQPLEERRIPWPDGIQCPVILNFHCDAETLPIAIDEKNARHPNTQAMYTYGPRVGVQRVLKLLRKYDITASFFIPGLDAERHPYMVEWIVADGHEIGCHGWTHDWPAWLEPEVEEEHLDLQLEALTRLSGKRPKGYIAPGFEYSLQTFDLLLSRGFEYSADWLGEDVPYYIEHKGKIQDFVAVPSTWTVDDAAVYWFALFPALSYGAPYWEPSRVFELWTTEFDALYEEGAVYHLNMHPFLSGRGVRIKTLERVIQYIMQRPGVRFCSMEQMVEMYKQVVTPEQGLPGAWFPAKGDPAPKINPIDGIPIFS